MSNMLEISDIIARPRPVRILSHFLSASDVNNAAQHRQFIVPSPNSAFLRQKPSLSTLNLIAMAGGTSRQGLADLSGDKSQALYMAAMANSITQLQNDAAQQQALQQQAQALQQQQTIAAGQAANAAMAQQQAQLVVQQQQQQAAALAQQQQMQQQADARQAGLNALQARQQADLEHERQQFLIDSQAQQQAQGALQSKMDASRWQQQQQDQLLQSQQQQALLQQQLTQLQSQAATAGSGMVSFNPSPMSSGPLPPQMPEAPAPWNASPEYSPTASDPSAGGSPDDGGAPIPDWEIPSNDGSMGNFKAYGLSGIAPSKGATAYIGLPVLFGLGALAFLVLTSDK